MGYFSEQDIIRHEDHIDHSFPSPEMQLRWRLEDLRERLSEITKGSVSTSAISRSTHFSADDLAYAPASAFSRESDILAAIEIAEERARMTGHNYI